jgi:hypothetical protein
LQRAGEEFKVDLLMRKSSVLGLARSVPLALLVASMASCGSGAADSGGEGGGSSVSAGGVPGTGGATAVGGTSSGTGGASNGSGGVSTGTGSVSSGTGGAVSGTGGVLEGPVMSAPPVVTLYSECEYQSASAALSVGDYDSAALTEKGLTPGAISSLKVTPGYKAILYTNDGFLGQTQTLNASSACLTDFGVASLRVREDLGGTPTMGTGGNGEPGPAPCDSSTPAEETCEPFGVLLAGKYWVNNNLWGQDAGVGEQCVRRTCLDGDAIAWETSWTWASSPSSVKSFASAVLGWHWGYHVQDTGLPVRLSDNKSVSCGWSYSVSQTGTMNVAYDLWFHSVPDPQWGREGVPTDQPTDELMIWPYKAGGAAPIGQVQGSVVSIAGALWTSYKGEITSNGQHLWNVYSFVRTENTSTSTLDLSLFAAEVVERGWMPNTRYLTSVQAGPEVFVGEGKLTTSSFGCTIQQ